MPAVCAEVCEYSLKSKCNALWNYIKQRSIAACDLLCLRGRCCDSIEPSKTPSNQTQPPHSNRDAKNAIRRRAGIYAMLTLAITRLARETFQSEIRHRRQLGVHCIVSICVLLRFCHAQFRSAFVRHLSHAQLRPSSTFMRLSGYDTSRPMARALSIQNRSCSEVFSVIKPMPTVCAESDEYCLKSKCNALWNQIKQRSTDACVLR